MVLVTLLYGPYESHGVIKHKTGRLYGIIEFLNRQGHEVSIVPSPHLNRLVIEVMGVEIYKCDIRNLDFLVGCEYKACKVITDIIREAVLRLDSTNNVSKCPKIKGLRGLLDNQRLANKEDSGTTEVLYKVEISASSILKKDISGPEVDYHY